MSTQDEDVCHCTHCRIERDTNEHETWKERQRAKVEAARVAGARFGLQEAHRIALAKRGIDRSEQHNLACQLIASDIREELRLWEDPWTTKTT